MTLEEHLNEIRATVEALLQDFPDFWQPIHMYRKNDSEGNAETVHVRLERRKHIKSHDRWVVMIDGFWNWADVVKRANEPKGRR